ncbi:MAG: hypothetical protein EKK53_21395 [Burkholderiales bacterium]|nr:MAG: hypothetical protein EKK53_21395 [Burkholderiales bacterium]
MTDDDIQAALTEAEEAYEAEQWEAEQAQTSWAEAGGYTAGLPRPLAPWERRTGTVEFDDGSNDIPF